MTDSEPSAAPLVGEPPALGVVDPIRIPGGAAAAHAWAGLPLLARGFLVATLVDLVARTLRLAGLPPPIHLDAPLSLLGYLPHLAIVLLPVAVLWRRPDAATDSPLVLWGAVALGLVELLSLPLTSLVPIGADMTSWSLLSVLSVGGRTAGYVLLAIGLARITRSAPSQAQLGLSNVVLWVIAGSAILSTVLGFLQNAPNLGDPGWNTQVQLVNAIGPLPLLAYAYLARIVIRGTSDVRRPGIATTTATGAVLLHAFLHAATLALALVALVQLTFGTVDATLGSTGSLVFGLLGGGADVLLLVAFGLGLADTSVRIPRGGAPASLPDAPGRAPVHWPEPGGDVPVYRPIDRPAAEADVPTPKRRTRGRRTSKEQQA